MAAIKYGCYILEPKIVTGDPQINNKLCNNNVTQDFREWITAVCYQIYFPNHACKYHDIHMVTVTKEWLYKHY